MIIYAGILILFFLFISLYFNIAQRYGITDRPNDRSSHQSETIRGAGTIYIFAALIGLVWIPSAWLPLLGLILIGIVSFWDDHVGLSQKVRLLTQMLSATILFYGVQVFTHYPLWALPILYFVIVGILNAYNFMDGINGLNGAYSLVVLIALQYVNRNIHPFIQPELIWVPIVATMVFLYYNFRTKARCFAGDVGSIGIAFWILWLLLSLIMQTHNYCYILFLGVYGVDSVFTFVHRLWLRQNVMEPHRLHFYQLLVNEKKIPHLWVSALYALLQVLICMFVIHTSMPWYGQVGICLGPLALLYILLKPRLMKAPAGAGIGQKNSY